MSPRVRSTLLFIGLLATACGFGSRLNEDGTYTKQFPKTPLSTQECTTDEECTVTSRRDGNCCGDPCAQSQVFNLSYYDLLVTHQEDICANAEFECPVATCPEPTTRNVGRCINQRCAAVAVPLEDTL